MAIAKKPSKKLLQEAYDLIKSNKKVHTGGGNGICTGDPCGIAALGIVMKIQMNDSTNNYCYFTNDTPERELLDKIAKEKGYSCFYSLNDGGGYRSVLAAYRKAMATL